MHNNEKDNREKTKTVANKIVGIFTVAIIIYFIYTAILLLYRPADIFMIEYDELTLEETVSRIYNKE